MKNMHEFSLKLVILEIATFFLCASLQFRWSMSIDKDETVPNILWQINHVWFLMCILPDVLENVLSVFLFLFSIFSIFHF